LTTALKNAEHTPYSRYVIEKKRKSGYGLGKLQTGAHPLQDGMPDYQKATVLSM
jgi:hypothetical protein